MKRARQCPLTVFALVALCVPAIAQRAPVLTPGGPPHFPFDMDLEGWLSPEAGGEVSICTDPDNVKVGEGSLQFDYVPLAGQLAAIAVGQLSLAEARSVRLWLKCTEPTTFALGLSEADGDDYLLPVFTPADTWVRVEAALSDFQLSDEDVDENGRLDPSEVTTCLLVDVACFLLAQDDGQVMFPYMSEMPRMMWLDELEFSAEAVAEHRPVRRVGGESQVLVDDFGGSFVRWLPVVQYDVEQTEEGHLALRYELEDLALPIAGILTMIDGQRLHGAVAVHVRVRTQHDANLALTVEERGGARYSAPFGVPGGDWRDIRLPLADFQLDAETTDDNGVLDPSQLKMLGLVDVGGMLGGYTGPQQVVVDEIAMVLGK